MGDFPIVAFVVCASTPAVLPILGSEAAQPRQEKIMLEHDTTSEDDDLDDLYDDDDDDWEDKTAFSEIVKTVPEGWTLVKIFSYTHTTLVEMREWCIDNCIGEYKEVRWSAGCSYSTGVMFNADMDIVLFKLRWGTI